MKERAPVLIRDAVLAEQSSLTELQRRASLHWEGYREQLLAHPDAVELPVEQIQDGLVRVAELGAHVVGFAVLLQPASGACELDGLFVEPAHMGAGVGRALIEDAMRIARGRRATRIEVVANPEAVAFYQHLGFTGVKKVQTRFGPARRMRLTVSRIAPPTRRVAILVGRWTRAGPLAQRPGCGTPTNAKNDKTASRCGCRTSSATTP